jgi:hypothetical protein
VASLSIILSLAGFLYGWYQDIRLRETDQANKVRNAAAITSAKLERWEEVSLSFFNEIQPAFVQASKKFAENYDSVAARDYLWEEMDTKRQVIFGKLLDEDIETAYVNLYGYRPEMRPLFRNTMNRMRSYEESMFSQLHADTESIILYDFGDHADDYRSGKMNYETAQMGNALRAVAETSRSAYQQQIEDGLFCVQDFLAGLVLKSDSELVHRDFTVDCITP